MWLACYTQEEIAEKENVDKATVSRICCEFPDLEKCNKAEKAAAEHATDKGRRPHFRAAPVPARLSA